MSLGSVLLNLARVGQAHAFFGNVYEAIVKVPHTFTDNRELAGRTPFRRGSPTLYFVPAGPVTLAASVAALAVGEQDRRLLATSTAATVAAGALTAYVVTRVNHPLFLTEKEPAPEDREVLLRRWYRLNAIRMALLGTAWLASERARRR